MSVRDVENGYAREVQLSIAVGGVLLEYILWEGYDIEAYGGGTFGWGSLSLHLEKRADAATWDEIWDSLEPTANPEDMVSMSLSHPFFMAQPRLGIRYYLTPWLALSGSVDFSIISLNSTDWEANGKDLYNAPSFDIIQPLFQFAVLLGG